MTTVCDEFKDFDPKMIREFFFAKFPEESKTSNLHDFFDLYRDKL